MAITLQKLKEDISTGMSNINDFKAFFKELKDTEIDFLNLLEYVSNLKKDDKEFQNFYLMISNYNLSDLIEKIKRKGYVLRKELGESFGTMGYRLIEQTREGKREDVYYGLLRIFVSNSKKFPEELIEAFKPKYSDEMFKIFIFTFLSCILEKETLTKN